MTQYLIGKTEEEITEMLDKIDVPYIWEFSAVGNNSTIIYGNHHIKFVDGICKKVLTK